jgi:hypothetical protein
VKYLLLSSLLAVPALAAAQTNLAAISQQILHEGMALYHLEQAASVSTDMLRAARFPTQQITAYFSYAAADSMRTLFVGGPPAKPQVLAEFRFASHAIRPTASRRGGRRALLPREQILLSIRQQSMADLQQIPGLALSPKAAFNAVLLPKGEQTWVYVLTGTNEPGVVLLGNDYLLRYDAAGRLLGRKKLHPGLIPIGPPPASVGAVRGTLHVHDSRATPFITPTDICTLLLGRARLPGVNHIVMGPKYVSVFSLADARLAILTRKAFEQLPQPQAGAGR